MPPELLGARELDHDAVRSRRRRRRRRCRCRGSGRTTTAATTAGSKRIATVPPVGAAADVARTRIDCCAPTPARRTRGSKSRERLVRARVGGRRTSAATVDAPETRTGTSDCGGTCACGEPGGGVGRRRLEDVGRRRARNAQRWNRRRLGRGLRRHRVALARRRHLRAPGCCSNGPLVARRVLDARAALVRDVRVGADEVRRHVLLGHVRDPDDVRRQRQDEVGRLA